MDAVQVIKDLVILDFKKFIKRLNVGYQDDYQDILTKISFIECAYTLKDPTAIFEKIASYG